MFLPLGLLLEHWIDHVTTEHIYVKLVFSIRYSTDESRAKKLILRAVFGAVDESLASCGKLVS